MLISEDRRGARERRKRKRGVLEGNFFFSKPCIIKYHKLRSDLSFTTVLMVTFWYLLNHCPLLIAVNSGCVYTTQVPE